MSKTRQQWLIFCAALFVLVAVALYSLYGMRQQTTRTMPRSVPGWLSAPNWRALKRAIIGPHWPQQKANDNKPE